MFKKASCLLIILGLFAINPIWAQSKWTIDQAHSKIGFSVTHLLISEVEGNFKVFTGTIVSAKPDFTNAVIEFSVDVASINTDNEMRDKHLKSPDFFDAEKYPKATFKSTSLKLISGNKYELTGKFSLHGVEKDAKFDVTFGGTAKVGNSVKAGFRATTVLNRFDYDLKWNKLTEAGGATVGKDVTIDLKLEFSQIN